MTDWETKVDWGLLVLAVAARGAWMATGHSWDSWGGDYVTCSLTVVGIGWVTWRLWEYIRDRPPDDPSPTGDA